jgi:SPP1 gp7 family putative phage head morphogenesis protein
LQDYTFDNIKGVEADFKNKLKQELRRAIIQSEGIGKVAEKVRKVFDITEERTNTIARTELNRAENQGQLQAFKKSGKKMTKTWLSAHDARTSDLCRRLDGQTVDIDAKFKDAHTKGEWDAPPSHVNCRSTLLFNAE